MIKPTCTHCNPKTLLDTVGGDKAMFRVLSEIFMRESTSKFADLKAAAMAEDLPKLGRHSHSLKGTVGPLAAIKLVQLLQDLEDDCDQRKKKANYGSARIFAIHTELSHVRAEMQQFIEQL